VHSHPTWLAARWVRRFGAEAAAALMAANNKRPAYSLRANAAVLGAAATAVGPPGSGGVGGGGGEGPEAAPAARLLALLEGLPGVEAARSPLLPAEFVRVRSGLQAVLREGLVARGICAVQVRARGEGRAAWPWSRARSVAQWEGSLQVDARVARHVACWL
jgi:16S rRNA (cytosine967-C5)-methyltransferase